MHSRYEDFTTIGAHPSTLTSDDVSNWRLDWIQDSILERNRRLKDAKELSDLRRGPKDRITLSWLRGHARKAISASQSWFVVSLVGASSINTFTTSK